MGCRIYCWDSYSIVTLLDQHLEQCRRKMLQAQLRGIMRVDISAHGPRPPGRNNTGQVTLQMRGSLSQDKDWNALHVES